MTDISSDTVNVIVTINVMTEQLHFHFSLSCIGEGNGNPLQCSCLENPRDGGAWWAAIYGVAQSQTWLKWLSSSSRLWLIKCLMLPTCKRVIRPNVKSKRSSYRLSISPIIQPRKESSFTFSVSPWSANYTRFLCAILHTVHQEYTSILELLSLFRLGDHELGNMSLPNSAKLHYFFSETTEIRMHYQCSTLDSALRWFPTAYMPDSVCEIAAFID